MSGSTSNAFGMPLGCSTPITGKFEKKRLLDEPVTDPEIQVYPEEDVFSIMVHELMHALGFGAHNDQDRFADSVMRDD